MRNEIITALLFIFVGAVGGYAYGVYDKEQQVCDEFLKAGIWGAGCSIEVGTIEGGQFIPNENLEQLFTPKENE